MGRTETYHAKPTARKAAARVSAILRRPVCNDKFPGSPPQQEEGWPKAGVVWSGKFLDHTTPSARTNEASRLFLVVQPPLLLLRRGVRPHQPSNCKTFSPAFQSLAYI